MSGLLSLLGIVPADPVGDAPAAPTVESLVAQVERLTTRHHAHRIWWREHCDSRRRRSSGVTKTHSSSGTGARQYARGISDVVGPWLESESNV